MATEPVLCVVDDCIKDVEAVLASVEAHRTSECDIRTCPMLPLVKRLSKDNYRLQVQAIYCNDEEVALLNMCARCYYDLGNVPLKAHGIHLYQPIAENSPLLLVYADARARAEKSLKKLKKRYVALRCVQCNCV